MSLAHDDIYGYNLIGGYELLFDKPGCMENLIFDAGSNLTLFNDTSRTTQKGFSYEFNALSAADKLTRFRRSNNSRRSWNYGPSWKRNLDQHQTRERAGGNSSTVKDLTLSVKSKINERQGQQMTDEDVEAKVAYLLTCRPRDIEQRGYLGFFVSSLSWLDIGKSYFEDVINVMEDVESVCPAAVEMRMERSRESRHIVIARLATEKTSHQREYDSFWFQKGGTRDSMAVQWVDGPQIGLNYSATAFQNQGGIGEIFGAASGELFSLMHHFKKTNRASTCKSKSSRPMIIHLRASSNHRPLASNGDLRNFEFHIPLKFLILGEEPSTSGEHKLSGVLFTVMTSHR
ncbi:hypothetical protein L218DRAFT_944862 [Marasmius fiardii PR-910]|nr:hypothetical protein L218DRAFT_944862 [Marasmius fiardii PR-910]